MIVLDASTTIDLLLNLPHANSVAERVARERGSIAAPHLLDAEVGQVLRRFVRAGRIDANRAAQAIEDLEALGIYRYPHPPFLPRAFALRDNATLYDALYLALAEALGASLVTRDAALGRIPGHRASVEVL